MDFGGLQRRLRAEFPEQGYLDWILPVRIGNGVRIVALRGIYEHEARRLGEVLGEGHGVTQLYLLGMRRLTKRGDYQPLLDFIQYDQALQAISFAAFPFPTDFDEDATSTVVDRFFAAVSCSPTIHRLDILLDRNVPTEPFLKLLRSNTIISDLCIWQSLGPRGSQLFESTFVRNTTITRLTLLEVNTSIFTGIFQAMKSNPSIQHLQIDFATQRHFQKLAKALPSFKGLRELACVKWPDTLNAMMMDAFRRNGSLTEVTLHESNGSLGQVTMNWYNEEVQARQAPLDPLLQRYLKRNRGIQRVMESPGTILDNLIPLVCAAAVETSLELDLIFALVKAKAHLFQDVARQDNEARSYDTEDENSEEEEEEKIKCSLCCLM